MWEGVGIEHKEMGISHGVANKATMDPSLTVLIGSPGGRILGQRFVRENRRPRKVKRGDQGGAGLPLAGEREREERAASRRSRGD